ncbi:MAG: zinc permease [Epulopiscium sp. Nuni2H_MBin001]|nr:MAG: zinc permease [Epulopiscium sp. Nuni2H_MBin001]
MEALKVFLLAFVVEGIGVSIGVMLLYIFNIKSPRLIGMLFGATAGAMISLISFDILPDAFKGGQTELVFIGVMLGLAGGIWLEYLTHQVKSTTDKRAQTGFAILIGIAIHNFPEGLALGTLALSSKEAVLNFAIILGVHSIPEAIAVAIALKEAKVNPRLLFSLPIVLASVTATGALTGYVFSRINITFITLLLGAASGLILYIIFEDLLPESKHIWNGRFTSIAAVLGMITAAIALR